MCNVARTKWPVSAAVNAIEVVSKSRISPTSITSGSSRSAALRAAANDMVSEPTSLWLIMLRLCLWRYSIGSSRVIMWQARSRLTMSIMAARVVDLPLPVGPVTKSIPRVFSAKVRTICGRPSSSSVRISVGITRSAAPTEPRW